MYKLVAVVFLVHFANSWVINNVDIQAITNQKLEKLDELSVDEPISVENNDSTVRLSLIYPGTKWCGAGDIANDFNDLGSEWKTDMCCREHDYCPSFIAAGETKHNLTNDAFYTRLTCKCDERFRKCLLAANSLAAKNIGITYFNALGTKCYRKDYPVLKCVKKGGWLSNKCLMYSYNTTSEPIYQWFDVNNYR